MTIQDILSIGLFSIVVYVGLSFAVLSLYLRDEVKTLRKIVDLQKEFIKIQKEFIKIQKEFIKISAKRRDKNVK
jgi:hypothetical protein